MKHSKSILREAYIILLGSVISSIPMLTNAQTLDSGFGVGQTLYSASLDKPSAVAQVDWNGNGEKDIIALGNGQRRFVIFTHQGDHEFGEPQHIGEFNADVNDLVVQDNRPEGSLIFWVTTENSLRKFEKESDSIYYRKTITEESYNINNLNLMDIDHDGDEDLLFLSSKSADHNYSFDLKWIEKQENKAYSNIKSLPADAYMDGTVLIEDLNNNGYEEILVVSGNEYNENISITKVVFDKENNSFKASERDDSILTSRPLARLSDFDNDGDKELVLAGSQDARLMRVRLYENRQGSLDSVKTVTKWGAIRAAEVDYFSISDFDGDGDKDFLAKLTYFKEGNDEHILSYKEQKSDIDFGTQHLPENYQREWDLFNDYNSSSNNTKCKIVGSSKENSIALVCYNRDDNEWMESPAYVYDPIASPIEDIKSIDINDDLSEEIIAVTPFDSKKRLALLKPEIGNMGEMETSLITQMHVTSLTARSSNITISDINEDGYDDIIFDTPVEDSNENSKIAVFLNNKGTFRDPIFLADEDTIDTKISGFYSADLTGDGFKDIVVKTSEGTRLVVKRNDKSAESSTYKKHLTYYSYEGNENFSKVDTILKDYIHNFHSLSDINNDNYPDLVFTKDNKEIYIAQNNKDATFDSLETRANIQNNGSFRIADLNTDGSPELLKDIRDSTGVDVYQQNSAGEWTEKINSVGIYAYNYALTDFNQDGNLDFAYRTIAYKGKELRWKKNLTGFEFSESKRIDNGFSWRSDLEIADIDGDEKSDILMLANENKITWYQNNPTTSISESGDQKPDEFKVYSNYPNPFNPSTRIRYQLPDKAHVSITIYDIAGREVAQLVDKEQSAGEHSINFDAGNLGSGVYFYRIKSGEHSQSRKMTLIK